MKTKLVIFGSSAFAEVAYEYFSYDSDYEVVGFTVTKEYLNKDSLFDLPVVPFENIEESFSPEEHSIFVALTYSNMNLDRQKYCEISKAMGYSLASYISSKAFVWRNAKLGEHVFVFEDNTIQPFVEIGDNVILWSGNHIGHHSRIDDNCFISSHVVISGFCEIGKNCFFGVNSTINNNIKIGDYCLLGSGSIVPKNLADGTISFGHRSENHTKTTFEKFDIQR